MDFLTWGRNPWGQQVLTHISWDLMWASLFAGIMFLVAHASYMVLSAHRKSSAAQVDALEAANKDLPDQIERHTFMARMFHWVMAASMFVLLFTAFLPIVGIRFAWVWWHWMAGLVLTGSIIYHIIHATFFLDFWSIWVGPRDIPEFKAEMLRELGHEVPGPKSGKYPLGNRLYHLAILVTGLAASITGILMMSRIRTPLFNRDPYIMSDVAWGWTYVAHGVVGVGLIGLVIAHVYFAVRPDKWWITKSMIFGYISRRHYVEHHDTQRWNVRGSKSQPASRA
jgi:cytochrome b subunit of formate dehydrogenase